ncbi:MAG: hypothetical protein KGK07_17490 [Chloroflexota bacterium]|nr:hypothetical protein [Chloroflexota bacterium]
MAGEAAALTVVAQSVDELVQQQLDADERQLGLWSEPQSPSGQVKLLGLRRGAGRPPGARNKRTEATVAHLLQRYRDPRAVALERIEMHPADLAAILGCSIFEAAQEQRLYMAVVFPFIHARITPDVIDNRAVIHLHVGDRPAAAQLPAATNVRVFDPAEVSEAEDPSAETPSVPQE